MDLYILDPEYNIVGTIDEAESVLWNKKYNGLGYCEIYIPCKTELLTMLQKGNYVYRFDDDMFCKIETVAIQTNAEQGDYIIATANDISVILAGRISRYRIAFSGSAAEFIKKVLIDNVVKPAQTKRAVPNFIIDDSNFSEFTESIDISTVGDDVLQLVLAACNTYNYGFRLSFDISARQLVFRLYRGKNKALQTGNEYVEFSPNFSNILSSNYKEDESNYKNVVYVGYENTAEEFALLSLFKGDAEPSGEDRREIYVDGTSTKRSVTLEELQALFPNVKKSGTTYYNGETAVATSEGEGDQEKITITDYTYLLLIRVIGENALAERIRTQEFTGEVDTIDTYEYKTDYDLGDFVKVVNEYGIEATAQITEVMESDDNDNGYIIEPHFEYLN